MNKQHLSDLTKALLASVVLISSAISAAADDKSGGTLMVGDKSYSLAHAVAYETTNGDEQKITGVLSGGIISSAKLKEAMEQEEKGDQPTFNRPYLRLEFTKAGELSGWTAGAGGT